MKTKLIILLILTTMIHTNTVNAQHSQLKRADFQQTIDGKQTDLYFLRNKNGIEIAITNFGGRVVEFWTPDKKGHFEDIVLGHDHVDKYLHYKGERFLGATIGRYGNRINKGKFTLNGQTYQLPINDTPNSLHGGFKGFDMVVWDVEQPDSLLITSRVFCGAEASKEITSAITGAPFSPVRVSHFNEVFLFTPKKFGKTTGFT